MPAQTLRPHSWTDNSQILNVLGGAGNDISTPGQYFDQNQQAAAEKWGYGQMEGPGENTRHWTQALAHMLKSAIGRHTIDNAGRQRSDMERKAADAAVGSIYGNMPPEDAQALTDAQKEIGNPTSIDGYNGPTPPVAKLENRTEAARRYYELGRKPGGPALQEKYLEDLRKRHQPQSFEAPDKSGNLVYDPRGKTWQFQPAITKFETPEGPLAARGQKAFQAVTPQANIFGTGAIIEHKGKKYRVIGPDQFEEVR